MLLQNIAIVTIGRNEGDRLINCLHSLKKQLPEDSPIIYVDSGSTDGSVEQAQQLGATVIELDLSIPFTAARARNTGLEYIINNYPQIQYIQFLDGDCELFDCWLAKAVARLNEEEQIAIVCGRRKEKYPEKSIYNRLIDMEWATPIGETEACGGDALMRIEALKQVNGYNHQLICGEEPEMCIRLRQKGWKIERIDIDMTLHDAAMYHFSQWWKRSVRGGWAIAEGYAMYGNSPEKYYKLQDNFSGYFWGFLIPFLALVLSWYTKGFSFLLFLGYGLLIYKIYHYRLVTFADSPEDCRLYAIWCVFSKFPQFLGQCQYWWKRFRKRQATIIEYKDN
jgi:glycosyltransferase involved in cell wall biosynthesis